MPDLETPSPAPAPAPAPSPAPSPAPAPSPTPDGSWRDTLPDALKGAKSLERYKDVAALAQGHLELEKTIGKRVAVPGPDAKPEDVAAYRKSIGVPDAPVGYELKYRDDVPWAENAKDRFSGVFHAAGVTPAQAQTLIDALGEHAHEQMVSMRNGWKEQHDELRKQWGSDLYDKRVAYAQRAVVRYADEATVKWFEDTGFGDHPGLVQMFAMIGEQLAEDGWIPGAVDGIGTPDSAKQEIAKIRGDRAHPFNDANHPGHAEAQKRMDALYKLAYGTQEVGA